MVDEELVRVLKKEHEKNLKEIIRQAVWNAEMVRKLGKKWFEIRDKWLEEAFKRDRELWRDPKIREALVKAILTKHPAHKL
ncbi:MAG: hypothetical protein J7K21_03355 [Desulfurococcales archaeon]|nr:hypothetical protein [Desulfurococcales archaeon]